MGELSEKETAQLVDALIGQGVGIYQIPKDYRTPASNYVMGSSGKAELSRYIQPYGLYPMEGVDGNAFYYQAKDTEFTHIKRNGKTWMVDDPLHWVGMKRLANACFGKTLCIGLGLGLIENALAENKRVKDVTVLDIDSDVISLMCVNIPSDQTVVEGDMFTMPDSFYQQFDSVVIDIFVSDSPEGKGNFSYESMMSTWAFVASKMRPNRKWRVFVFGSGSHELNPAVKPMNVATINALDKYRTHMRGDGRR